MEKELRRHGVHFVENYEFSDWELVSGVVKRCYFTSPTEAEAKISFPTFALFCYRYRRVDDDIVSGTLKSKVYH